MSDPLSVSLSLFFPLFLSISLSLSLSFSLSLSLSLPVGHRDFSAILNDPNHLLFGCLGYKAYIKELNLAVSAISRCIDDFSIGVLVHLHI